MGEKKPAGPGGWLRGHKRFWQWAALCAACLLALGWAFLVTTRAANGRSEYQIVNDDYSRTIAPADPAAGLIQELMIGPDAPLYGVRLLFTTYGRVAHGALHVDLLNENLLRLAHAECELTELLDNTFKALIFDRPLAPSGEQARVFLHIYTEPETQEDVVGLWCSETALPGLALFDAGSEPQAGEALGTAALQYVVDYTGAWASRLFWAPAALLLLAVLAG